MALMRETPWWSLWLALIASCLARVAKADEGGPIFERDVVPLLKQHCVKCHGGEKVEGGLDLRRRFLILKGGDSGTAFSAGKPDESLLIQRVLSGEMPPDKNDRLQASQIDLLKRWIAAGAKTQAAEEPRLNADEIPSSVSDADRAFWAFQSPRRPPVPIVSGAERVRTLVDAFLLKELEARGLSFNPDADRAVLLRRVHFDLLGLPPSPELLQEFLSDARDDAYERLVDRLLASPSYGERWGRHWLDIAGYADSDGYLAADRTRPEAWRYRDYVIRAFNRDLPYDQFVAEQLAGDELVDWRRASELNSEMSEALLATGFLRTALDPTYPGYTEPNEIHQVLADTMQIVGSTFLGLTVQCARCHAHKSDPLSQRDYYSLQAIFAPALDAARWQPSEVRGIPLATESQLVRITEVNQKADARVAELLKQFVEIQKLARNKRLDELLLGRTNVSAVPTDAERPILIEALVLIPEKRTDPQKMLVSKFGLEGVPSKAPLVDDELAARFPDFKDDLDRFKAAGAAEAALKKSIVKVRGLMDLDEKLPVTRIMRRGDYTKPGAEVLPAIPAVLATDSNSFAPAAGYKTSGRRAALAKWLTHSQHPLTSRVHVNRVWAHHFGRGLVPTVANFGHSGTKPSHPELLDWLATEFIRQGWSQKSLHRLIVTSTVYRQTSASSSLQQERDPRNVWLSAFPPRRHTGEVVRDSLLAVSARLHPLMYGSPSAVHPQGDGSVITADDSAGNRRTIYVQVRRSQHLTLLELFDTPLMEVNCPERPVSTVPLQSLAMWHSPMTDRAAAGLSERLLASASNDPDRLVFAFRLLFTRDPAPAEQARVTEFLHNVVREQLASKPSPTESEQSAAHQAAWKQLALVLLNSNEFLFAP